MSTLWLSNISFDLLDVDPSPPTSPEKIKYIPVSVKKKKNSKFKAWG